MTTEIDYAGHMTEAVAARIQAETKAGKKRQVDEVQHLLDIAKMIGRMMMEEDADRRRKEPETLITDEKQIKARIDNEIGRIFELADANPSPPEDPAETDRIGKMEEKQRLRNEQLVEKKKTKKNGK
ncbi:unnamed protein product [Caenorhabditis brenneri]